MVVGADAAAEEIMLPGGCARRGAGQRFLLAPFGHGLSRADLAGQPEPGEHACRVSLVGEESGVDQRRGPGIAGGEPHRAAAVRSCPPRVYCTPVHRPPEITSLRATASVTTVRFGRSRNGRR